MNNSMLERRTMARIMPLERLRMADSVYERLLSEHRIPAGREGQVFLARLSMPGSGTIDCALFRCHVDELLERIQKGLQLDGLTMVEVLLYLERIPYVVSQPVAQLRSALNRHIRGGAELRINRLLCDQLQYSIRHRSRAAVEQMISRSGIAA